MKKTKKEIIKQLLKLDIDELYALLAISTPQPQKTKKIRTKRSK
jgi:hypothetical protein